MISREKLEELINKTEGDINFVEEVSDKIVKEKTEELDTLMHDIYNEVVNVENLVDEIIEKHFLKLTNAVYFISAKCEMLGFYDDMSKTNSKLAYNEAYFNTKAKQALQGNKPTVSDLQLQAENDSINEAVLNLIYSRSFKIIKVKLDAANEMIKTLSKILTSRISDKSLDSGNAKYLKG